VPANRDFRDGIRLVGMIMRTTEERKAAELAVAESHAKLYEKEAAKDADYQWLADKCRAIVESLK
jgi:hypothetical protein